MSESDEVVANADKAKVVEDFLAVFDFEDEDIIELSSLVEASTDTAKRQVSAGEIHARGDLELTGDLDITSVSSKGEMTKMQDAKIDVEVGAVAGNTIQESASEGATNAKINDGTKSAHIATVVEAIRDATSNATAVGSEASGNGDANLHLKDSIDFVDIKTKKEQASKEQHLSSREKQEFGGSHKQHDHSHAIRRGKTPSHASNSKEKEKGVAVEMKDGSVTGASVENSGQTDLHKYKHLESMKNGATHQETQPAVPVVKNIQVEASPHKRIVRRVKVVHTKPQFSSAPITKDKETSSPMAPHFDDLHGHDSGHSISKSHHSIQAPSTSHASEVQTDFNSIPSSSSQFLKNQHGSFFVSQLGHLAAQSFVQGAICGLVAVVTYLVARCVISKKRRQ